MHTRGIHLHQSLGQGNIIIEVIFVCYGHQEQQYHSFVSAFFLWANAMLGRPDMVTGIISPEQTPGTVHCLDFWFDLKVFMHIH